MPRGEMMLLWNLVDLQRQKWERRDVLALGKHTPVKLVNNCASTGT